MGGTEEKRHELSKMRARDAKNKIIENNIE